MTGNTDLMDKVVSLCKRRGFVFPGSEIYGGLAGIYDLGPLGVELSNNIKKAWWENIVQERDNVVGLDSSILMTKDVWHASGHVESFTDPLAECKKCHARYRMDMLPKSGDCPNCGKKDWTPPRMFNLMFKTHIGPVEDEASVTFLRPETAQGIFVNFGNVVDTARVKLPFGIAQIGKGFRNEITTGNFLFRVREFEMMELEYFTYPKQAEKDFDYWQGERMNWFINLGINKNNLRFREHKDSERAHYAVKSVDIEYNWPFMGWGELEGIANRTDYDLKQHAKESGKDLFYFDEEKKEKIIPYVIEPSAGVSRAMLALLIDGYSEEKDRIVLKLHPRLAPVKVAVFPLLANKPDLVKKARSIYQDLKSNFQYPIAWDDRGNIGKRYYAQDEIGTPYCITVDFQTLEDDTVTIRDRDSAKQERVNADKVKDFIQAKLI
ncbi:glycine--tRNA ligase [Candidatus Curtissbacteria bacterium RBG_16_39_7]|uniref:Glycine--tRNA ligase n=1 Tax=Candidatus Curtissbacteria bacterium RBG_16_39_7 TaxID=1797707 RepID=A0A1F5G287_9BACT|nr:MAG: glycine--tRNA ligase [Candidatus Curtissbacteria bacterium RBG_16_39_7]